MTLPQILVIPEKLYPIVEPDSFNKYRYFLLEGGRGGAKSQSIGRFILYLGEKYALRVVCGRETQASITESVYSLMADLIDTFQLNYEVHASKIVHRATGTTINFRGFREQGRFNIQGMEGVDILWIDEAQAITKQTLDVLIPTIRKEKARVFFSMNRYLNADPVYAKFKGRDDCLHININFDENNYCPAALLKEAEECRKMSERDYDHIWRGQPVDQTEDALYTISELTASKALQTQQKPGYGRKIGGFDIARYGSDKCTAVILQQLGALHWKVVHSEEWDKKDLNYTTGRILLTGNEQECDQMIIDEDGMGAGPLDTLVKGRGLKNIVGFRNPKIGYQENRFYGNVRTLNAYKLKHLLMKGHICIPQDEIINELLTIKYTFDHNQRRILVSKDKMRKDGIKSPNLADALIMAVSQIEEVQKDQKTQYANPRLPAYAEEGNLFEVAGVR